jgi:hypothetical protein
MSDHSPPIAPEFPERVDIGTEALLEIVAHLGAALIQSDYTDDPIILDHVRGAHKIALMLYRSNNGPASTPDGAERISTAPLESN